MLLELSFLLTISASFVTSTTVVFIDCFSCCLSVVSAVSLVDVAVLVEETGFEVPNRCGLDLLSLVVLMLLLR